jgi:hypothetical protein
MPDEPQPFGPDSPPCPHCKRIYGIIADVSFERNTVIHEDMQKRVGPILCGLCRKYRTDVTWPEEK